MGSKPSRQSKATKANIRQIKKNELSRVTQNITHLQTTVISSSKSDSIINKSNQQVLAATLTAQNQLQKGGATLSKDDMVAIAIFIKTATSGENMFGNTTQFSALTREDLVTLIRTTVFDPAEIQKLVNKRSEYSEYSEHLENIVRPDRPEYSEQSEESELPLRSRTPVKNHIIFKTLQNT